ncbi:DUF2203 family protein [Acidianus sulfidivorans JP7]|uniref:DUF2203 domain-containing protein n=1 Tax=Acidianus sulfidivorans JP7 TaxID=619593 RepID=A0A2U9IKE6_9CREN|nr:DUF2203 domain-containing protein [Acidianus sulfidivorans]AWR96490.1 DUF2203 family protein [Acidianus sulfidivorans JP7]
MIYFDIETANSLLPWIRQKLIEIRELKYNTEKALINGDKNVLPIYVSKLDKLIREITEKGIILRDIELGIIDFPAVINNRPAYLCWREGEEKISYWHYVEEGYKGRKVISGKEDILSYT